MKSTFKLLFSVLIVLVLSHSPVLADIPTMGPAEGVSIPEDKFVPVSPPLTPRCSAISLAPGVPWPPEDGTDCQHRFDRNVATVGKFLKTVQKNCGELYDKNREDYVYIYLRFSAMPPQFGIPAMATSFFAKFGKDGAECGFYSFVDSYDMSPEARAMFKSGFKAYQKITSLKKAVSQGAGFESLSPAQQQKYIAEMDKSLKKGIDAVEASKKVKTSSMEWVRQFARNFQSYETQSANDLSRGDASIGKCDVSAADALLTQAGVKGTRALLDLRQAYRRAQKEIRCTLIQFHDFYGPNWQKVMQFQSAPGVQAQLREFNTLQAEESNLLKREKKQVNRLNSIALKCANVRTLNEHVINMKSNYFEIVKEISKQLKPPSCSFDGVVEKIRRLSRLEGGNCGFHIGTPRSPYFEEYLTERQEDCRLHPTKPPTPAPSATIKPSPIPSPSGPLFDISELSVAGIGSSKPKLGEALQASAEISILAPYSGLLSLTWKRASDGFQETQTTDIDIDSEGILPAAFQFPALSKNKKVYKDSITLEVSDGADQTSSKTEEFVWIQNDAFRGLVFSDEDGKQLNKLKGGTEIVVTSTWDIAEGNGSERLIQYVVNSQEFGPPEGMPISVEEGKVLSHSIRVPINDVVWQHKRIQVEVTLKNPKTGDNPYGKKTLSLADPKDKIRAANPSHAPNAPGDGIVFQQGDPLWIVALVKADDNFEGNRTVKLSFRGKQSDKRTVMMKAGEEVAFSFPVNSNNFKLPGNKSSKRFSVLLKLYNDQTDTLEDTEHVDLEIVKRPQGGASGLQDVYCSSPDIILKVWDHGNQDGDVISLKLGDDVVMRNGNLNQCGGKEPSALGGVCAWVRRLSQGRMSVSVYAHNTGSVGPNTASLKVSGGCTPEVQKWNMQKDDNREIWVYWQGGPGR